MDGEAWATIRQGRWLIPREELRRDAFRYYIPMLTMWRKFPYRDPNLPTDYLPPEWHGPAVRRTFQAVHRLAAPLAAAHAHEVIAGGTGPRSSLIIAGPRCVDDAEHFTLRRPDHYHPAQGGFRHGTQQGGAQLHGPGCCPCHVVAGEPGHPVVGRVF